jgi:hypothetical protein
MDEQSNGVNEEVAAAGNREADSKHGHLGMRCSGWCRKQHLLHDGKDQN